MIEDRAEMLRELLPSASMARRVLVQIEGLPEDEARAIVERLALVYHDEGEAEAD